MDTPLINGASYNWGIIKVSIFGVPIRGITEIDYKEKQKKENLYGSGYKPVSRGYGQIETDGSITIYTEELKRIIEAAPGRNILKIPPFDIHVIFESGPGQVDTDILKSCEFTEHSLNVKAGDTNIPVKIPLIIGDIVR